MSDVFRFKQFSVRQREGVFKVGTDGVLLGAWADASDAKTILDIGTGTGMIALMMAQRFPTSKVEGIEIDETAAELAFSNFVNSPWKERLQITCADVRSATGAIANKKYDHILSNPPFFSSGTLPTGSSRTNARHQKSLSFQELFCFINQVLNPNGRVSLVIPSAELEQLFPVLLEEGFQIVERVAVRSKKEKKITRFLLSIRKNDPVICQTIERELTMQKEKRNEYTKEYLEMIHMFYLDL